MARPGRHRNPPAFMEHPLRGYRREWLRHDLLEGQEFFRILHTLITRLENTHLATLLFGLGLILLLLLVGKKLPKIPGALAASAVAILVAGMFDLGSRGVAMVDAVPGGIPLPALPSVMLSDITALAPAAVAIAFLAFSGGKTQLVAAGGLLLFLVFFTGLIALLPKVALGAILVAGVVPGIILGMLLSLIGVLVEISRPRDAVLARVARDGKFHDIDRDETEAETVSGLIVYRLYAPMIFANARYVITRLRELVARAEPGLKWIIIDAQAITDMDITAAQRFAELHRELAAAGIEIKVADAPRPFREELGRVGLADQLGQQQFYVSVKKAVEAYEAAYPEEIPIPFRGQGGSAD